MDQLIQFPDEVRRRRFKCPYPLFNSIGGVLRGGQTLPGLESRLFDRSVEQNQ